MIYNTSNEIEAQNARAKLEWFISNKKKIEIKGKNKTRSRSQNAYQHVLFGFYGLSVGLTAQEVKQDIYKRDICRDIFVVNKNGRKVCRSTADLDTKETAICIDRFIDRSMIDLGLRLPTPLDKDIGFWEMCKNETEKWGNANWL